MRTEEWVNLIYSRVALVMAPDDKLLNHMSNYDYYAWWCNGLVMEGEMKGGKRRDMVRRRESGGEEAGTFHYLETVLFQMTHRVKQLPSDNHEPITFYSTTSDTLKEKALSNALFTK